MSGQLFGFEGYAGAAGPDTTTAASVASPQRQDSGPEVAISDDHLQPQSPAPMTQRTLTPDEEFAAIAAQWHIPELDNVDWVQLEREAEEPVDPLPGISCNFWLVVGHKWNECSDCLERKASALELSLSLAPEQPVIVDAPAAPLPAAVPAAVTPVAAPQAAPPTVAAIPAATPRAVAKAHAVAGGSKKPGQLSGWPQAINEHKRRCRNPFLGCRHDCPVLGFSEAKQAPFDKKLTGAEAIKYPLLSRLHVVYFTRRWRHIVEADLNRMKIPHGPVQLRPHEGVVAGQWA